MPLGPGTTEVVEDTTIVVEAPCILGLEPPYQLALAISVCVFAAALAVLLWWSIRTLRRPACGEPADVLRGRGLAGPFAAGIWTRRAGVLALLVFLIQAVWLISASLINTFVTAEPEPPLVDGALALHRAAWGLGLLAAALVESWIFDALLASKLRRSNQKPVISDQ